MIKFGAPTGEHVSIDRGTLDLLLQVAEDAADLITCNCSYPSGTKPGDRCDGSCTHGMAKRALAQIHNSTDITVRE
jgi:hypothetical protein